MTAELILYACPLGPLAEQIKRYFDTAKTRFSWNPANDYMPHCSLTGFFHDYKDAITSYIYAMDMVMYHNRKTMPSPAMTVSEFQFREDFHGLILSSDWLLQLTADFAVIAPASTRKDDLRLKRWLHLSLAYQFPEAEHHRRTALAQKLVTPEAPVSWNLCFYQRHPDNRWTCHGQWPLMHTEDLAECS